MAVGVDAIISGSMQRWILLGLVAVIILFSAAAGGVWYMRQNRPDAQWIPMPINATATVEQREQSMEAIRQVVTQERLLLTLVKEHNLQAHWKTGTEYEAVTQLKSVIFVREGETRHPMTQEVFSTIDVGMKGKRKEKDILGKIAMRLAAEIRSQLGSSGYP